MKKALNVTRVGFVNQTGDNRSPESFPFPACMASLVEALGEDYGTVCLRAHDREYSLRLANAQFLGATSMAFGLLWHDDMCPSCMDLTQVNDHDETIRRAFAWAGYEYETVTDAERALPAITRSIDAGAPALIFGLFDIPECAIVAGYDGDALLGYSHFQKICGADEDERGMFRAKNWREGFWKAIIPQKKVGRSRDYEQALSDGLDIMRESAVDGYRAGRAAYAAWRELIASCADRDEKGRASVFHFHNSLLFSHAEARCWGASFLSDAGASDAAAHFSAIHDLCWKADAALAPDKAASLADAGKRAALIAILDEIAERDARAEEALSARLGR